jgi:hypothetical protein
MIFSGAAYSSLSIDDVFNMIAKNSKKTLNYTEIHSETIFTKEIKATGRVSFSDSGAMSKYAITPKKSEMHIVGDTLSLINNDGVKSISLTNYPVLASSVNAIRWILSGEKDKVLENYSIGYSLMDGNWIIELTPINKMVLLKVLSISIEGSHGNVDVITLTRANGANVSTTFSRQ